MSLPSLARVLAVAIGLVALLMISRVARRGHRVAGLAVTLPAVAFLAVGIFGVSGLRATATRLWLVHTGGLVDVGGYSLRIDCRGEGSPTVVLDAGLDQGKSSWGEVPGLVAEFTRACAYDRPNLGESDPSPAPLNSSEIASMLHLLLVREGIRGPQVLVGHSFGGLNVRMYASRFPDEVAGMVLVDPSHEDQYRQIAAGLPAEQRIEYLRHEGGANLEGIDLLANARAFRPAPLLPPIPLVVLSAHEDAGDASSPAILSYDQLQASIAAQSPTAMHLIVEPSGHFIQLEHPDVVVRAIRRVVDAARRPAKAGEGQDASCRRCH